MRASKLIKLLPAAVIAVLALTSTNAFAGVPPECATGRNLRGYQAGQAVGDYLVQSAWLGYGQDYDFIDDFKADVPGLLAAAVGTLPANASDYVLCRAAGMLAGAGEALDTLQDAIADECFVDGQIWGELSALAYCTLAIHWGIDAIGIILPATPTATCAYNFVTACEASFDDGAEALCPTYTVGAYQPAFEEALYVCIY